MSAGVSTCLPSPVVAGRGAPPSDRGCRELIESSHPIRTTTAAGSRSTIGPNDDVGRDERVLKLTLKALGICVAGWIAGVILILLGFEFIGIVVGGISIPVALCYWVVADAR
jgi:hypothetical protein